MDSSAVVFSVDFQRTMPGQFKPITCNKGFALWCETAPTWRPITSRRYVIIRDRVRRISRYFRFLNTFHIFTFESQSVDVTAGLISYIEYTKEGRYTAALYSRLNSSLVNEITATHNRPHTYTTYFTPFAILQATKTDFIMC